MIEDMQWQILALLKEKLDQLPFDLTLTIAKKTAFDTFNILAQISAFCAEKQPTIADILSLSTQLLKRVINNFLHKTSLPEQKVEDPSCVSLQPIHKTQFQIHPHTLGGAQVTDSSPFKGLVRNTEGKDQAVSTADLVKEAKKDGDEDEAQLQVFLNKHNSINFEELRSHFEQGREVMNQIFGDFIGDIKKINDILTNERHLFSEQMSLQNCSQANAQLARQLDQLVHNSCSQCENLTLHMKELLQKRLENMERSNKNTQECQKPVDKKKTKQKPRKSIAVKKSLSASQAKPQRLRAFQWRLEKALVDRDDSELLNLNQYFLCTLKLETNQRQANQIYLLESILVKAPAAIKSDNYHSSYLSSLLLVLKLLNSQLDIDHSTTHLAMDLIQQVSQKKVEDPTTTNKLSFYKMLSASTQTMAQHIQSTPIYLPSVEIPKSIEAEMNFTHQMIPSIDVKPLKAFTAEVPTQCTAEGVEKTLKVSYRAQAKHFITQTIFQLKDLNHMEKELDRLAMRLVEYDRKFNRTSLKQIAFAVAVRIDPTSPPCRQVLHKQTQTIASEQIPKPTLIFKSKRMSIPKIETKANEVKAGGQAWEEATGWECENEHRNFLPSCIDIENNHIEDSQPRDYEINKPDLKQQRRTRNSKPFLYKSRIESELSSPKLNFDQTNHPDYTNVSHNKQGTFNISSNTEYSFDELTEQGNNVVAHVTSATHLIQSQKLVLNSASSHDLTAEELVHSSQALQARALQEERQLTRRIVTRNMQIGNQSSQALPRRFTLQNVVQEVVIEGSTSNQSPPYSRRLTLTSRFLPRLLQKTDREKFSQSKGQATMRQKNSSNVTVRRPARQQQPMKVEEISLEGFQGTQAEKDIFLEMLSRLKGKKKDPLFILECKKFLGVKKEDNPQEILAKFKKVLEQHKRECGRVCPHLLRFYKQLKVRQDVRIPMQMRLQNMNSLI